MHTSKFGHAASFVIHVPRPYLEAFGRQTACNSKIAACGALWALRAHSGFAAHPKTIQTKLAATFVFYASLQTPPNARDDVTTTDGRTKGLLLERSREIQPTRSVVLP